MSGVGVTSRSTALTIRSGPPDEVDLLARLGSAFTFDDLETQTVMALDVFQHAGLITSRHRYEDVVAAAPDAA